MVDKRKDLTEVNNGDVDGGDNGGGDGTPVEESYVTILQKLGVDTNEMSIDDIQNMIHQYTQEGVLKGAKVIDMKTGKSVQTYKKGEDKTKGRAITVKNEDGRPLTQAEFEKEKKERDYKAKTDEQNQPSPEKPFSPPTPRAPG